MKYYFLHIVLVLFATASYAMEQNVSIGAGFDKFNMREKDKISVSQVYTPVKYSCKIGKTKLFVNTGFVYSRNDSSENLKPAGTTHLSEKDTKFGAIIPVIDKKLMVAASYMLPIEPTEPDLNPNVVSGLRTFEGYISDVNSNIHHKRIRDGGKINISAAYLKKWSKAVLTTGLGCFINTKYDSINPGDFVLANAGLRVPFGKKWGYRNEMTVAYTFPTVVDGYDPIENSESFTVLGIVYRVLDKKRKMRIIGSAGINAFNTEIGKIEDKNSNRNSVGLKINYDLGLFRSIIISPTAGATYNIANEWGPNANYELSKPAQARGELGFMLKIPVGERMKITNNNSLFLGNHELMGVSSYIVMSYGVK